MFFVVQRVAAVLIVIAVGYLAYQPTLFPISELSRYPWGSDTWGHLIKVEYLRQEVGWDNLYPNIFPDWYAGMQLFRYYAPLPYYLLLGLFSFAQEIFLTSSWFIFLCALFGGLCFFLYERWIGLWPSALGGALFTLLPDNVRVAFAEGNLPRTLAAALLPLTFYVLLDVMQPEAKRSRVLALAAMLSLVVLSHAMMGAIFLASLSLFTAFYWLLGGTRHNGMFRAVFGLGSGLMVSGWWLFPSLTGGITDLSQSAVTEALAHFPVSISLNPFLRSRDPEIFYVGLGLGIGALLAMSLWRRLDPLARAALLTGLITFLITTSFINPIYRALPFNQLFWPMRFASFIGFILLFVLVSLWQRSSRWFRLAVVLIVLVTVADFWRSSDLVHLRPADPIVKSAAEQVQALKGWRVATADLSRLGSAPSFWFSNIGNREQIYGWGYQGARIAANVANINHAMDRGYPDYAIDRLEQLGVDDVLFMNGALLTAGFDKRLERAGYRAIRLDNRLTLYHKDGGPRAFEVSYDVLGIGDGAQNLSLVFPEITVGPSVEVDDYDAAFLSQFKAIVLTRFSWQDKEAAERLITEYARAGGTVLIDLTGAPTDIRSRQPKVLGVYGEPLHFAGSSVLERDGKKMPLLPFVYDEETWLTTAPQGVDVPVVTFNYYGQPGVALGYKELYPGRVWFTGLNLPFHAVLTRDPVAVQLLSEVLGIRPGDLPSRRSLPLREYKADQDGYTLSFETDRPAQIVVPVSAHEGAAALLDGQPVKVIAMDSLVAFNTPAGSHSVRIYYQKTTVYAVGLAATALACLLLFSYLAQLPTFVIRIKRRGEPSTPRVEGSTV